METKFILGKELDRTLDLLILMAINEVSKDKPDRWVSSREIIGKIREYMGEIGQESLTLGADEGSLSPGTYYSALKSLDQKSEGYLPVWIEKKVGAAAPHYRIVQKLPENADLASLFGDYAAYFIRVGELLQIFANEIGGTKNGQRE